MYVNSKFDEYLQKSRAGQCLTLPSVSLGILRNYNEQRVRDGVNPFNMLLITEININEQSAEVFLDFLYTAGVRQIIWSDASTASLRHLALLMAVRKYRINVLDSAIWTGSYNRQCYGLVLEIVKRRK